MTNYEAEARPRRFTDQRGIALQTVIIMVVLLAIAGGIAAVLLSRGDQAASQLEGQNLSSIVADDIKSESLCTSASGLKWDPASGGSCKYDQVAGCTSHGGVGTAVGGAATGAAECYTSVGGTKLGVIG